MSTVEYVALTLLALFVLPNLAVIIAIFLQNEWFTRLYFRVLFRILHRKRVVGIENVPSVQQQHNPYKVIQ